MCSTACWTWDAQPTSASPELAGAGVSAPASLIRATSVDAPLGARRIVVLGAARRRVLTCVRPLMRRVSCRGPGWEMLWGERRGAGIIVARQNRRSASMPQLNDQSRSHTALKPDSTLIAVLEMSQSAWLVAGLVPGIERHPLKKIEPDEAALLRLLRRWQEAAINADDAIPRFPHTPHPLL